MHSTLKPEDPFNFSHYTGTNARTLHVQDKLGTDFFVMSLELILMIIKKYGIV